MQLLIPTDSVCTLKKKDAKGLRVNIGNKYDRVIIAFLAKSRRETLRLRQYKRVLCVPQPIHTKVIFEGIKNWLLY